MEVKSASASSDSSIRQPGEVKSFFKRIRSKKGNQVRFFSISFCEDDDDVFCINSYASIAVRKIRNGPV